MLTLSQKITIYLFIYIFNQGAAHTRSVAWCFMIDGIFVNIHKENLMVQYEKLVLTNFFNIRIGNFSTSINKCFSSLTDTSYDN